MYRAEIFLVIIISLTVIMLLCQNLSIRITMSDKSYVTIEYFPIKILLYNFSKRKIRKKKLIKQIKRLLFFLAPTLKSIRFLIKRTVVTVYDISFPDSKSDQPDNYFLTKNLSDLLCVYIYSILYSVPKSAYVYPSTQNRDNKVRHFDFEITARLYTFISVFAVLIFYSIKKRGMQKLV